MKYEKTEGKAPLDIAEQNHPPSSRNKEQEKSGSISGGHAAPGAPNK